MASNAQLTAELMDEFDSVDPQVRQKVENHVGGATVDILLQNDSRFRRLKKYSTITLTETYDNYRLPSDFRSIAGRAIMVDANGLLIKRFEVVSSNLFFDRKTDPQYGGDDYAYIENRPDGRSGPGDYLVLNEAPDDTAYLKVFYYRKPTEQDTDIIEHTEAIKEYVRSQILPDGPKHLVTYERMKSGIIETASEITTGLLLRPSKQQMEHNRRMREYGRRR